MATLLKKSLISSCEEADSLIFCGFPTTTKKSLSHFFKHVVPNLAMPTLFFKARTLPLNNPDDFHWGKLIVRGTIFWEDIAESDPERKAVKSYRVYEGGNFLLLWRGVVVILGRNSG